MARSGRQRATSKKKKTRSPADALRLPGKTGVRIDAFGLKLIAIAAMCVDHIGALIYPEALWLRVVGRLAMPIIAFLLVEGYHHTRHLGRYLLRLLMFAVLAQPVYRLVFPQGLNVLFDLLAGLCVIWVVQRSRLPWLTTPLLLVAGAAGFYFKLDWWHLGIFMIFAFHVTRGRFGWTVAALSGLLVANAGLFAVVSARTGNPGYQLINFINLACLLALPLLGRYSGARGRDCRYFFYAFYPAHLLVIHMILSIS